MSEISNIKDRQALFAKEWFSFLRKCKANKIKMNQSVAAKGMGIKRSTFSHAVNYGPSDTVLLRFYRYTQIKPECIDVALLGVIPVGVENNKKDYLWAGVEKAVNA